MTFMHPLSILDLWDSGWNRHKTSLDGMQGTVCFGTWGHGGKHRVCQSDGPATGLTGVQMLCRTLLTRRSLAVGAVEGWEGNPARPGKRGGVFATFGGVAPLNAVTWPGLHALASYLACLFWGCLALIFQSFWTPPGAQQWRSLHISVLTPAFGTGAADLLLDQSRPWT